MIIIHGIKNCDTVKKTLRWFSDQQVPYEFRDFKKVPPNKDELSRWIAQTAWDVVVNKRGTTWRQLTVEARESMDAERAIDACIQNPSLIKRPVIETGSTTLIGFQPEIWLQHTQEDCES